MDAAEIDKWVRDYLGYLSTSDDVWKSHWLRMLIRHSLERGRQEGVKEGFELAQNAREARIPDHQVQSA